MELEQEQVPQEVQEELDAGNPVYDTKQLQEHFTVIGFQAPYVVVTRKSDGQKGSLMFTHRPRFYFGFVEYEGR